MLASQHVCQWCTLVVRTVDTSCLFCMQMIFLDIHSVNAFVQVACQMLQVQPVRNSDRATLGLGRPIPATCPILLQRLHGHSAQPLQCLWGASHRHGRLYHPPIP